MHAWREGRVRAVERIEDAAEADARVLDHLAQLGCDPAQPRECRHYLYLPAEGGARAVAHELNCADGWFAECEEVADRWLVVASTVTALSDERLRATRSRFELLASDHGGLYDGWEAAAD